MTVTFARLTANLKSATSLAQGPNERVPSTDWRRAWDRLQSGNLRELLGTTGVAKHYEYCSPTKPLFQDKKSIQKIYRAEVKEIKDAQGLTPNVIVE